MASDLIYRTTASVTFWTRTTQEAKGKLAAMEGITGPNDGEVIGSIEWVESGKPPAPPAVETLPTLPAEAESEADE